MRGKNLNIKTVRKDNSKSNKMTEHEIQDAIRLELSRRGVITFRENIGSFKTEDGRIIKTGLPVGTSDLLAILPGGLAAWIEVKTPTGSVRPEQENFINRMKSLGHTAGVARSVEEAVKLIGM